MQTWGKITGAAVAVAGVASLALAPLIGGHLFDTLWGVEPLTYIGAMLLICGLGGVTISYVVPGLATGKSSVRERSAMQHWSRVTRNYFELFDHDLGRPFRRILGSERELRAILQSSGAGIPPALAELLDEIERQTPNFRLMMSNIRVLVDLEAPYAPAQLQAVEPSEVVRKIVARYASGVDSGKEITWWSEPAEFGIVYSDSSAIEHVVTNLVDNAMRFASSSVEVRISRNPTHFFIRVWDDGPGVAPHYLQHIFDRGWTPEVARREEKPSSGLGLFIARTLAARYGGDLTVESVAAPAADHHAAFLLSLPLGRPLA